MASPSRHLPAVVHRFLVPLHQLHQAALRMRSHMRQPIEDILLTWFKVAPRRLAAPAFVALLHALPACTLSLLRLTAVLLLPKSFSAEIVTVCLAEGGGLFIKKLSSNDSASSNATFQESLQQSLDEQPDIDLFVGHNVISPHDCSCRDLPPHLTSLLQFLERIGDTTLSCDVFEAVLNGVLQQDTGSRFRSRHFINDIRLQTKSLRAALLTWNAA